MPRMFIVRPLNVKEGINLDEVDCQLFQPTLTSAERLPPLISKRHDGRLIDHQRLQKPV